MGERLLKTAVLSATLGIALIAFSGMSLASDDFAGGCKRKEQAIETKMEYARKHGNQEQLRGLEEALSQVLYQLSYFRKMICEEKETRTPTT